MNDMDKKKEDMRNRDMFYVKAAELVALLAFAFAMLGAMGCSAGRKTVTSVSSAVKRDSSVAVVRDTVWRDRFVERIVERVKREATSVKDSTVFTVDNEGNVVKTDHWRMEKTRESSEETERLRDSVAWWKARYEGVLVTKVDSMVGAKETIVKEEKNTRPVLYWWNVAAFVVMGVVAVAAIANECWRRKNEK